MMTTIPQGRAWHNCRAIRWAFARPARLQRQQRRPRHRGRVIRRHHRRRRQGRRQAPPQAGGRHRYCHRRRGSGLPRKPSAQGSATMRFWLSTARLAQRWPRAGRRPKPPRTRKASIPRATTPWRRRSTRSWPRRVPPAAAAAFSCSRRLNEAAV